MIRTEQLTLVNPPVDMRKKYAENSLLIMFLSRYLNAQYSDRRTTLPISGNR